MNNKKIFFICFQWALVTLFIFFGLYWNMVQQKKLEKTMIHEHDPFMDEANLKKNIRNSNDIILSTETRTVHRHFVKMKFGHLYIFGAAAGNSSELASWDIIKIYGGIDIELSKGARLRCCLAYQEGRRIVYEETRPVRIRAFLVSSTIWSIHLTCMNLRHEKRVVPIGAAITVNAYTCNGSAVNYVQPYFPLRETTTKLAIGTKTAYGNVSAEMIIEWMEAYKYLGVDKVVSYYVSTINRKALKVLEYYASTGILDLYYYEPAASDIYPRNFYADPKQRWNDQQIVVADSFERMSGYRYFGIIDHDEFLVPARGWTIKQMLDHLFTHNENATGLSFKSRYFYLSWGKSSNKSDMIIGSYVQRPAGPPKFGNTKSLYMPSRVDFGGADTHVIKPSKRRYKMYSASPGFGLILHFRKCRPRNYTTCMTKLQRVTDMTVATWAGRFRQNVEKVREIVFGSKTIIP